jgi:hypothetical protein
MIIKENTRKNISIKFFSLLSHNKEIQSSNLFLKHHNFKFLLKYCFDSEACINKKICYMGVVLGGD